MKPARRNVKISKSKIAPSKAAKALKVGMGVAKTLGPIGLISTSAAAAGVAGAAYAMNKKKKKKKNGNKA